MNQIDEPGGPYLRLEDVKCFLEVYERAKPEFARHTSYRSLLGDLLGEARYTTLLSQLRRIADFADRIDPHGSKRRQPYHRSKGQPLHLLFRRLGVGEGGLQPTREAKALYDVLSVLMEVYDRLVDRAARILDKPELRPEVRGGAASNFSYHVCPFILSQWKENGLFGDLLDLRWTTGNTTYLLPKLDAGVLDFVISYGLENLQGEPQKSMQAAFSSFGYYSRAILACHPTEPLWLKNGQNYNDGYFTLLQECSNKNKRENKAERGPRYEQLRKLSLDELRTGRTNLIVTRSYTQPRLLAAFLERANDHGARIQIVDSYEEAAMQVKLGYGVAVLPEVYSKRRMMNAFRLVPEEDSIRWIGAYYSTRFPLSQEAYTVLEFLRKYFTECCASIRNGRPDGYGDDVNLMVEGREVTKDFGQWCREFQIESDWLAGAKKNYPLGRMKEDSETTSRKESSKGRKKRKKE